MHQNLHVEQKKVRRANVEYEDDLAPGPAARPNAKHVDHNVPNPAYTNQVVRFARKPKHKKNVKTQHQQF